MTDRGVVSLEDIERAMQKLERSAPLLAYFQPKDPEKLAFLTEEAFAGKRRLPGFEYPEVPDLAPLRRASEEIRKLLEAQCEAVSTQLLARLGELDLDLDLLEARETPRVRSLTARRFRFSALELESAAEHAARFLAEPPEISEEGPLVSLAREFELEMRRLGIFLPLREVAMFARAAVSEEAILVKKDLRLPPREAKRIVAHELHGHFARRRRDVARKCPLSIGMPECDVDEEGYAVFVEEERGLLSDARKRELALRFVLSLAVRNGAEIAELVALAERANIDKGEGIRASLRVLRGGGLAREVVYLPAYLRVKDALARAPELREPMAGGRASIAGLST